ncbi:hypothetical protein DL95DRAFT_488795, partial [Leptodontidium sp. 2 PMI_412]
MKKSQGLQKEQKMKHKTFEHLRSEVLNHTRFERITFRSGIERAAVAPAVLDLMSF